MKAPGPDSGRKNIKRIARELYASTRFPHPSVLKVLGFAQFGGQVALVTPWMDNGSLRKDLVQNLDISHRFQLCTQIAQALEGLHLQGVVHGDIKPDNIMLSDDGRAQLADFGSAVLTGDFSLGFTATNCTFTTRFAAPELLKETGEHTTKSDIYALAMTILNIMTGQQPFPGKKTYGIIMEVVIMKNKPSRSGFPVFTGCDQLWELLERCWAHMPEDRPTAAEVSQTLVEVEREARG